MTDRPDTMPRTPLPGTSSTPSGIDSGRSRPRAARTIAAATTWGDTWSSDAAARRSSSVAPSRGTTSVTTGRPAVSVPVLSSSSTRP